MKRILCFVILAAGLPAKDRIATIEFLGYQGVDVEAVRTVLPFHEGDKIAKNLRGQAQSAVQRVTGRPATDVALICCTGDGDTSVFIGLPGTSSQAPPVRPAPGGKIEIPAMWRKLSDQMDEAEEAAVHRGLGEEEMAMGYRLSKEPAARAAELAFRDYAMQHEDLIIQVLELSGRADERAMAADALGYSARTPGQLTALVHAASDPDPLVRNEAARAIGEILEADRLAIRDVQPDAFVRMIHSGIWTDRNKASMVLEILTESRDPGLLARLQTEAGEALLEMASWQNAGWATAPRMILDRIAALRSPGVVHADLLPK